MSSTTKGFLPPRLTAAKRDAILSPAAGLMAFNSSNALEMYTGLQWITMGSSSNDPFPSIQIGTQVWQAKNLDVAFYRNGDPIPQVRDAAAWAELRTGAWCWYKNDSTYGTKYGKLYNWFAINDERGLAPQGWRIPYDEHWTKLSTTLGGALVAGGQMKEAGTFNWARPNTGGNNSSGFAGLPGGFRFQDGSFFDVGNDGYWWCRDSAPPGFGNDFNAFAWYRRLTHYNGGLTRNNLYNKRSGFSIRCLRN